MPSLTVGSGYLFVGFATWICTECSVLTARVQHSTQRMLPFRDEQRFRFMSSRIGRSIMTVMQPPLSGLVVLEFSNTPLTEKFVATLPFVAFAALAGMFVLLLHYFCIGRCVVLSRPRKPRGVQRLNRDAASRDVIQVKPLLSRTNTSTSIISIVSNKSTSNQA